MLRFKWRAVHRPRKQNVIARGRLYRQASLIVLLHSALDPTVESCEENLSNAVPNRRLL